MKISVKDFLLSCFCVTLFFCPSISIAGNSPKSLKEGTLVKLEALENSSDKKVRKEIRKARKQIKRSLSDKDGDLFLDESQIVPPPRGEDVFEHASLAIKELKKALKNKKIKNSSKTIIEEIITDLIEADRQVAEFSIQNAEMLVKVGASDSEDITQTIEKYSEALTEKDPEKAIEKFKHVWEKVYEITISSNQLFILSHNDTPDPFSPEIESNTLTAAFQIEVDKKNKASIEESLDFVEVIKDSSGIIVKTIRSNYPITIPESYKGNFLEIAVSNTWDGTDEQGILVEGGVYTYLAYGELELVNSNGESKNDFGGISFPVTGTIEILTITDANLAPTADAGPDHTTTVGIPVSLDGSRSTDPEGDPLTYSWSLITIPEGSSATLSDPNSVNPSFSVDVPGPYVAELTVNDGIENSAPDQVLINTENSLPIANAGPDQKATVGQVARLDGSGSSDVDGDLLDFSWFFMSVPQGSTTILSDAESVYSSFEVDVLGRYEIGMVVNDGSGDSEVDTVSVIADNMRPVAVVGPDQRVVVGSTVQLDGSGSSDVDGDALIYFWSLTSVPDGSSAILSDVTSISPSFVVDLPGTYIAQLIVDDGMSESEWDTVVISTQNARPVAVVGPDQTANIGDTIQLDGSGSIDADDDPLGYFWSLIVVPEESAAELSDPDLPVPTFVADQPGIYIAQLIVADDFLESEPKTITITVNGPPNVFAGDDQTITLPAEVSLSGTVDDDGLPTDPGTLTFTWTQMSGPGTITFADPNALTTTASFSASGSYELRLTADDGGLTAFDELIITVDSVPNTPPFVANPIVDVTVNEDADDTIIDLTSTFSDVDNEDTAIIKNADSNGLGLVAATVVGNSLLLDYVDNASGVATITVEGTSNGQSVTTSFTVTVNPANDSPTAEDQTVATDEGAPVAIMLTADDVETLNNDDFIYTLTELPTNGMLVEGPVVFDSEVTVALKDASHPQFGVGNAQGFVLNSIQGQELNLVRGVTYTFDVNAPGHPFYFSTSAVGQGADPVTEGVSGAGVDVGTVTFTPNETTPDLLYYACQVHPNMGWQINVQDAPTTPINLEGRELSYIPGSGFSGNDSFQFTVTDNGDGNDAPITSSTATVTIEVAGLNDLPEVQIDTPGDGQTFSEADMVTIAATAVDNDGTIVQVEFLANSVVLGADTEAPFNFEWNDMTAGVYILEARATDDLGGVGVSDPTTISVVVVEIPDLDQDNLSDVFEQQIVDAEPDDEINTIEDVLPEDDFDNDSLTNLEEFELNSVATLTDSDGNGMDDARDDHDADRYPNIYELRNLNGDPNNASIVPDETSVVSSDDSTGTHNTLQAAIDGLDKDFSIIEISPDTYTGENNTGITLNNYKTLIVAPGGHKSVTIDGSGDQQGITLNEGSILSGLTLIDFKDGAIIEEVPQVHHDLLIRDYPPATETKASCEVTWHP